MSVKKVATLQGLIRAAKDSRTITVPGTNYNKCPAKFMVRLQAVMVWRLIQKGMYVDFKPIKRQPWWTKKGGK